MGPSSPSSKSRRSPQFSVHIYCGQTAGWMKIPLGTEVDLSPGYIVLDGDPAPPRERGTAAPHFSANVYCGHGRPSQLLRSCCSVCLCVCEQVGCRTITSTILYRFSPYFARGSESEMWSLRRLMFVRQTGSSFPIIKVCGFRFRHFSSSDDHIFQPISIKSHIQIKFSNADFLFNGE